MITIEQAWELIELHAPCRAVQRVNLMSVVGRRLAEDLTADLNSPPFDKCMMDGFAVQAIDIVPGARLRVLGSRFAGDPAELKLESGTAIRVMTGAPLPAGADAVVMVELSQSEKTEVGEFVEFQLDSLDAGRNTMACGRSMKVGDTIFSQGHIFRPSDVGLLAEMGQAVVPVIRLPDVAVLATGNELVPCDQLPGPASIRNSNGPMLIACAQPHAASVKDLGIAPDIRNDLTSLVSQGLRHDVLILSGGVSAGDADLVPEVLKGMGVNEVFHEVAIKPGKPVWFGVMNRDGHRCLVFGLPGNPVSSLVCFEMFVRYALDMMTSADLKGGIPTHSGILTKGHQVRGDRPVWWPSVHRINESGSSEITPLRWLGSSDMRCLANANALACFQPNEAEYAAGTCVPWRPLGSF